MTQGHGPHDGQQGQWGQGDQNAQPPWGQPPQGEPPAAPQWGQSPQQSAPQSPSQWGQASPAPGSPWGQSSPAPGTGYPGDPAAGAFSSPPVSPVSRKTAVAGLVKWMFIGAIAVVALRGIYLLSNVIVSVFIVGLVDSVTDPDALAATAGISMLALLLFLGLVTLVSLALLVLAIIAAVKAAGRGRVGAIVVGSTVVLSFAIYLVARVIGLIAQNGAQFDSDALMTIAIIEYVVMALHWLVVSAALIVGSTMARRWVKQAD